MDMAENRLEDIFIHTPPYKKNIFSARVKNFPQENENTREIIENMSEIF